MEAGKFEFIAGKRISGQLQDIFKVHSYFFNRHLENDKMRLEVDNGHLEKLINSFEIEKVNFESLKVDLDLDKLDLEN